MTIIESAAGCYEVKGKEGDTRLVELFSGLEAQSELDRLLDELFGSELLSLRGGQRPVDAIFWAP